jgi:hypothetical protein
VQFTFTSVQRILESRFYVGMVSLKGVERPGLHEAIVSEEQWAAVQARRMRRGRAAPRGAPLLMGMVFCVICGRRMESGGSNGYYRERARGLDEECMATVQRGWRGRELEVGVASIVRTMALDGDWLARCASEAVSGVSAGGSEERVRLLEQRRRLALAHEVGAWSDGEFVSRMAEVNRGLALLPGEGARVDVGALRLRGFGEVWDVLDGDERREVVNEVLAGVGVDLVGREWWVRPREEYAGLFRLRNAEKEGLVRPGGLVGRKPSQWGPLYAASELGVSL